MGMRPARRAIIFSSSLSTQTTSLPRSAKTAPVTSPTYPLPTTQMFMEIPFRDYRLILNARFGIRNNRNLALVGALFHEVHGLLIDDANREIGTVGHGRVSWDGSVLGQCPFYAGINF